MAHFDLQLFAADGHLNFDTKIDEKGFSSGIGKLGGIAKGGLAILGASVAGITTAFAGMSKAALGSVASLEQNVGGVETLFKENAKTVIENANNAYKTAGLSANEYMQSVTSFSASLLQSVAGDTAEAAKIADMAMVDMSDNANKMGTDMTSIQNAYQGFAKQNYTMLDNLKLGYGGTKEEMNRLLADASKISGVKYDISNLNDVYSAIHVIQGELGITGTTAKEASTTIEGSMNAAKAAFDNFLNGSGTAAELADAIAIVARNVGKNLGEIIPRLAETVPMVVEELWQEFEGSADQFIEMGAGLVTDIATGLVEQLPTFIELAVSFINTLIQGLNDNMPQLLEAGGSLLIAITQGIIMLVPSLLSLGLSIIDGIIQGLMANAPTLQAQAANLFNQFTAAISTRLPKLLQQGADALNQFVQGLLSKIPSLISNAGNIISKLCDTFLGILPQILETGKKLIGQLAQGIISNLPEAIGAAAKALIQIIATIASHLPEILQKGIELLSELAVGIIQGIPILIGKLPEVFTGIKDKFLEFDWLQIGKDIVKGIANGLKGALSTVIDAAKSVGEAALNGLKSLLGIHSPSRVFRDEVGRNIAFGIGDGIRQNKDYAKKNAEDVAQATLDAAKKKLENHKVYNKLALAEEAGYWDEVRRQIAEGTQARIDADREYLAAKKDLDDQMLEVEQTYTDKVAQAYKDLNDKIQDLNDQYKDAVSQRSEQIKSAFGLFDEFDVSTELTADDLLNNLQSQVDGLRQWRDNLKELEHRGIGDDLLEELRNLGPQAAAEIQLMTEMSDDQLDEYVSLFRAKNRIARQEAVAEMEPMREEISQQIAQMQRETSEELASYQKEYMDAMTELGVSLNQPMEAMKLVAAQNAVALVSEMAGAVKDASSSTENVDKFKAIAQNILGATETLPNSMEDMGKQAITGMIDGIKAMSGQLYSTMQSVVSSAVQAAVQAMVSSGGVESAIAEADYMTGAMSVPTRTYGNEGYGPGYLMDYRRMGQEMATAIDGMSVRMDGKAVGNVVSEPVNDNLGGIGRAERRDM